MEKSFGRDAAPIETNAAEFGVFIDENDFHLVIGCMKGRGIATGTTTNYQQLSFTGIWHCLSNWLSPSPPIPLLTGEGWGVRAIDEISKLTEFTSSFR